MQENYPVSGCEFEFGVMRWREAAWALIVSTMGLSGGERSRAVQRSRGRIVRAMLCVAAMASLPTTDARAQTSPTASATRALTPFATQKAERLLREKLACLGCHALRGDGGKLAPALGDVRARRSAANIAAIIIEPQRVVPGAAMPRVEMLRTERDLVIRYLGGDPNASFMSLYAGAAPRATETLSRGEPDGAALYGRWCAGCHGVKGGGDGPNARNLPVPPSKHADATSTSRRTDDALFDTIHGGGAIMNRSARMPAFGGSLSSTEIRALVRYIRTLCSCQGPSWSRGGGA